MEIVSDFHNCRYHLCAREYQGNVLQNDFGPNANKSNKGCVLRYPKFDDFEDELEVSQRFGVCIYYVLIAAITTLLNIQIIWRYIKRSRSAARSLRLLERVVMRHIFT